MLCGDSMIWSEILLRRLHAWTDLDLLLYCIEKLDFILVPVQIRMVWSHNIAHFSHLYLKSSVISKYTNVSCLNKIKAQTGW